MPVRAGSRRGVVRHADNMKWMAGGDILSTGVEVSTVDGEHVCTSYSTLVARGTA